MENLVANIVAVVLAVIGAVYEIGTHWGEEDNNDYGGY